MDHPTTLIQLDSDKHASVFDAMVAIDSGIAQLLQYSDIEPSVVKSLVHGAMFTRAPATLKNTAIFVGGSNVQLSDAISAEITNCFFGPMRVSVMIDGNGCNTTAAAAVLCAARHIELNSAQVVVLGGTGPVGIRVTRMLLANHAAATIVSRDAQRAQATCNQLISRVPDTSPANCLAVSSTNRQALEDSLARADAIIACGAAGITLLSQDQLDLAKNARVAIDLNAVPPSGIAAISATDKAVQRGQRLDYGAIGVGGLKMKIHRQAIRTLFTRNDLFLDAEEILAIGQELERCKTV